jgi:hypothetical protein
MVTIQFFQPLHLQVEVQVVDKRNLVLLVDQGVVLVEVMLGVEQVEQVIHLL